MKLETVEIHVLLYHFPPMPEESLKKIEETIRKSASLAGAEKKELLGLVAALRSEVKRLEATHPEQLAGPLASLAQSVEGMESSHPKLTAAINAVCSALARIGI